MKSILLKEIEWPKFGKSIPVGPPSIEELENRLEKCRQLMQSKGLTHLVVYGDREHFANLMYLVHFDPRFEEALLIISENKTPLLLVGNECVGHLPVSPLYTRDKLRHERYQSFSLLSQPRDDSRALKTILESEGIGQTSKVGCIGWKYFSSIEFENQETRIDIPSYIADELRDLCGYGQVVNATDLLMSPSYGLRSTISVYEIAYFEHANVMASEGMINLLKNFKEEMTDTELAQLYQYNGYPMNCHMGMKSSGNKHYGLSSPVGSMVYKGEPFSTNIAYWGSNICRAGWVAYDDEDLPEQARDYVENFAAPYFMACAEWYKNLKIGAKGRILRYIIDKMLPFDEFGVFLNPGHLIHYDEWVSSPIYEGSEETIRSGMYFQVDIIPRSSKYASSRMEDGIVIADETLREELSETYPSVYNRCMMRRKFMIEVLGFTLPEEILPLSNMPALVPPYFLNYKKIFTILSDK